MKRALWILASSILFWASFFATRQFCINREFDQRLAAVEGAFHDNWTREDERLVGLEKAANES